MITEDYVDFETAKLLKEKGFDCNTNCYYIEGSDTRTLFYSPIRENHNASIENNELDIHINISSGKMSSPTLQMAMKWLRDTYSLEIYPYHAYCEYNDKWWFEIIRFPVSYAEYESDAIYLKYEVACEAAVRYCLENLI